MLTACEMIRFFCVAFGLFPLCSAQTYYCLDAFSCRNDTISIHNPLNCHGLSSCANIAMDNSNSASHAELGGRKAAINSRKLNMREDLELRGYMALFNGKIVQDTYDNPDIVTVGCNGEAACMGTQLIQSYDLYCEGFQACSYLNASVAIFQVKGAFSMQHSNVYSSIGHKKLTGEFTGYFAGYNTTVYCLSGMYFF